MRRFLNMMSDLGSVILAIGILVFFLGRPGYQPTGEYGTLIGIGVVLAIAVAYLALEGAIVLTNATPSPLYFALETFISHVPGYALMWVVAAYYYGVIVPSAFQWVTFAIFTGIVLIDLVGIVAIVARQLLLTDEVKGIR